MKIQIGDKVRSFDFAIGPLGRDLTGEGANFIEGVVVNIADAPNCGRDCPHFHIEVGRVVTAGSDNLYRGGMIGEIVFPPVDADFGRPSTVEKIK